MTTAILSYIDPASFDPNATAPFEKPWNKVDGPGKSYGVVNVQQQLLNLRHQTSAFSINISGFGTCHAPSALEDFNDEQQIRTLYYNEVESLLRKHLDGVKKVVIFDHTIRKRATQSPRQPVQLVHIDQTPAAAEARVLRHTPAEQSAQLLKGRFQIVNVWRPIQHVALDTPLAVLDWRTTAPTDLVKVDLLYPQHSENQPDVLPVVEESSSPVGYDVRGEQYVVSPNKDHQFYYVKEMTPDEVLLVKCFDSRSDFMTGEENCIAHGTGHTAFTDPQTPDGAPLRQSIEVRCLVFYD
ncbi:Aspirochlorine biosynthesis protein N [Colletotrichum tropicale]|nr:Aspirochlorine biosynthesis protein N [Colletotrichum tropicale]